MLYNKETIKRVIYEAQYFIFNECTIRDAAKYLDVPKSTLYDDLTIKLPEINWNKYLKVRKILDKHMVESPYRAGEATRRKWQKIKQSS